MRRSGKRLRPKNSRSSRQSISSSRNVSGDRGEGGGRGGREELEAGFKMSQRQLSSVDGDGARELRTSFVERLNAVCDGEEVLLFIRIARDGAADEVLGREAVLPRVGVHLPEGKGSEFAETDTFEKEESREGNPSEVAASQGRPLEETIDVDVDGMSTEGFDDRNPPLPEHPAEGLDLVDPAAEVLLRDDGFQSLHNDHDVSAGDAAVGGMSFHENLMIAQAVKEVRKPLAEEGIFPDGERPAHVREAVFLEGDREPINEGEHPVDDLRDRQGAVLLLSCANEPGILCEAAGVEEEGNPVLIAETARCVEIGEGNGLSAARVIRDGCGDQRNVSGTL